MTISDQLKADLISTIPNLRAIAVLLCGNPDRVTRGKRLVVLVGQKKAVAIAVRAVSGRRRWSKLNERLGASSIEHPHDGRH